MGSLTGAVASQNVTEAFTKVSLARMEIELDAQTQKLALLQGLQPEQSRKRKLVNRPPHIGEWKING
jgi:hypothetical protein